MKRYSISWKNGDSNNNVDVIAATFTKALNYCQEKVVGFILDNVTGVYVYNDILIAE